MKAGSLFNLMPVAEFAMFVCARLHWPLGRSAHCRCQSFCRGRRRRAAANGGATLTVLEYCADGSFVSESFEAGLVCYAVHMVHADKRSLTYQFENIGGSSEQAQK